MSHHGQCLCEEIQYTVDGPLRDIINCHCTRCRRSTGHFMAASQAKVEDIHIEGDTLKWYNPTETVQYGFCSECGSTLFWRSTRTPDVMSIAAGTLTPPTGLKTTTAIYTNYGSDYHVYDETLASFGEDRTDTPYQ